MKKSALTKRQRQIFDFILTNINHFGYPPSIPEIQAKFSFKSPNAVQDHFKALERKGYIARRPRKSRGIEILNNKNPNNKTYNGDVNVIEAPILGKISAGMPLLAQENMEGSIFVDKFISKNSKGLFALKIKGTSMINAGIFDGDFVLVRQQPTAEQGEIVAALIEDEATVKRFYRDKDKIRLKPENDAMKPIIIDPDGNNVKIIGKVEGVIRKV
ncbi:MAG: transcriptional repressor LexA [Elusimicrobia bacterium]|nr:transcriptional repressor LexA [Elusimicrobiota bacterium]